MDLYRIPLWGLEWLLKIHPRLDWMFNQIADDMDHFGFRLPAEDTVSYGMGNQRPVYLFSREIRGLMNYKNRSAHTESIIYFLFVIEEKVKL
jgi:hypothetical protein